LCTVTLVYANDASQNINNLASHKVWKQLLHAEQTAVTLNHNGSNFYLAENGFENPLSELEATIHAFSQNPKSQCQFPARKRLGKIDRAGFKSSYIFSL